MGPPNYFLSDILRTVKLDVIRTTDDRCFPHLRTPKLRDRILCGEDLQDIRRGTCGGDSGGPVKYYILLAFLSNYDNNILYHYISTFCLHICTKSDT